MNLRGRFLGAVCGVFFCGVSVFAGIVGAQDAETPAVSGDIKLSARVQAGRIILLWTPPNKMPSDGVKITRAMTSDFLPGSIDQYTKWLPGTGYKQAVLFPSAASDKTYYYRVTSIKTGEKAEQLAVSNSVKVEPMRNKETASAGKGGGTEQDDGTAIQ